MRRLYLTERRCLPLASKQILGRQHSANDRDRTRVEIMRITVNMYIYPFNDAHQEKVFPIIYICIYIYIYIR